MDFRAYRRRRVVVTGATGFVGRWVARELTAAGAELFLVVRDRARAAEIFRQYEIEGESVEADLTAPGSFRSLCGTLRPAMVFNLAVHGVAGDQRDPILAERLNASLPREIAVALAEVRDRTWEGPALVHAGSALEYGTAGGDLREDTPATPTTLYGITKLAGAQAIEDISAETGLPALTARLFMLYGPGEPSGRLFPALREAARTRRPLELTTGTQKRDFTYIEDVAEGLLRLGLVAGGGHRIVNLATGTLLPVRTFVETAAQVLDVPTDLLHFGSIPARVEEMEHLAINLDRLHALAGWTPATTIPEGVRKTLQFIDLHPSEHRD